MKIIWTDVETTGLDPRNDKLLEVACLVTDTDLNILDEHGFSALIGYTPEDVAAMKTNADPYVRDMHTDNGLWKAVIDAPLVTVADTAMNIYIRQFAPEPREAMLAGNSCRLDLNFLEAFLPKTYAHLHYRSIDVTSVRMLTKWWVNGSDFAKPDDHRAMGDVRAAIDELKHHRRQLGIDNIQQFTQEDH